MLNKNILFFLFISLIFSCGSYSKNKNEYLRIADAIQSHMVVQQAKPFTVWGRGIPGDRVSVTASWSNKPLNLTVNKLGNWIGKIDVPIAKQGDFTSHQITFKDSKNTIQLVDILIGEVWLCSGQSNMNMSMEPNPPYHYGVLNYEEEIASANYPNLRLIRVQIAASEKPIGTFKGEWSRCSPETVSSFGGVAYYYGKSLLQKLNIPVGLVLSAYGGSSCQAWTKKEVIQSDPILKEKYWDKYEKDSTYKKFIRPSLLYNAMIHPLRLLSINGFIWYQGESNANDAGMYTRLCKTMIEGWREEFKQGDLPFYLVQVAPYNWKRNDSTAFNYAIFREAQESILELKNTDMACIMDVGQIDWIHPRDKKSVGARLALLALSDAYKQENVVPHGPRFDSMQIKDDKIVISFKFTSVGAGLTTNDQLPPKYFFIAGVDKVFHPANAQIKGTEVCLNSKEVKHPVAVRYAFTNYPMTNFCNEEGLPAWPFRTDNWSSTFKN